MDEKVVFSNTGALVALLSALEFSPISRRAVSIPATIIPSGLPGNLPTKKVMLLSFLPGAENSK